MNLINSAYCFPVKYTWLNQSKHAARPVHIQFKTSSNVFEGKGLRFLMTYERTAPFTN